MQECSIDQIMRDDTVSTLMDPLGQYQGLQNRKVADLLAASPDRDPHLMAALKRMGYDILGYERGDVTARAMFGCYPGTMPSTGMVRTDRPMDPAKDVLVVFWGMNEIMTWNEREQANTALPYRELPAELVKSMRRMVRMMKRFPRSLRG